MVKLPLSLIHNCAKICNTSSFIVLCYYSNFMFMCLSAKNFLFLRSTLTSSYLLRKLEQPCPRSSQNAATPAQSHCYFCWGRLPWQRWSVKQEDIVWEEPLLKSSQVDKINVQWRSFHMCITLTLRTGIYGSLYDKFKCVTANIISFVFLNNAKTKTYWLHTGSKINQHSQKWGLGPCVFWGE